MPPYGMRRGEVWYTCANFGRERAASIFRRGQCRRFSVVKTKAAHATEMVLLIYQTMRRHIPEYHNLEVIVANANV
jgi:hypothetical protein